MMEVGEENTWFTECLRRLELTYLLHKDLACVSTFNYKHYICDISCLEL